MLNGLRGTKETESGAEEELCKIKLTVILGAVSRRFCFPKIAPFAILGRDTKSKNLSSLLPLAVPVALVATAFFRRSYYERKSHHEPSITFGPQGKIPPWDYFAALCCSSPCCPGRDGHLGIVVAFTFDNTAIARLIAAIESLRNRACNRRTIGPPIRASIACGREIARI